MRLHGRRILITGGAGFIGSNLATRLVEVGSKVLVYDNLSSGSMENIEHLLGKENFLFIHGDLLDQDCLIDAVKETDLVFHLAANSDVRIGAKDSSLDLRQSVVATHNLLECMKRYAHCHDLVFTSTSTVYGEATTFPTPEEYGPLLPISLYGAAKLSCEALISAYSSLFGFSSLIMRLANVCGSRENRGVIPDFIRKLKQNPNELEILGDGTQTKSYVTVDDCVNALVLAPEKIVDNLDVLNVGTADSIDVMTIARLVADEMGLDKIQYRVSSEHGGRGWRGDVKKMLLDIGKLTSLGWVPRYQTSRDAVQYTIRQLLREQEN